MAVNGRRLKIAITVDPEIPVPPLHYGGIERIVDMLVRGLVKRGHEVILFANKQSTVPCRIIPYKGESSRSLADTFRNITLVTRKLIEERADVVHCHSRLIYLLPLLPARLPKIMTYHRHISACSVILGNLFSLGRLHFTAVAGHIIRPVARYGHWHVVYNGTCLSGSQFNPTVDADAPLVFLGRIEEVKGTHLAIQAAQRSGKRLVIAGNIEKDHQGYFDSKIAPNLKSGQIDFVGSVDDKQRDELLRNACALLMPIQWEEPFGLVMIEAMACGTPVIGFRRGSVPEIIENGSNGFVCDNVDEMASAVLKIHEIDRRRCRQTVEKKFSSDVIVDHYENLYYSLIGPLR